MGIEAGRELIDDAIELADLGRRYWIKMLADYGITKQDMVIFLINDKQEYNYYTLRYLKALKESKKLNKIVIVSDIDDAEGYVHENASVPVTFVKCSGEEARGICKLYMLYKFSRQIIINTFKGTSDVDADKLVGVGDISEKDIVAISILGLPEVPVDEI